MEHARNSVKSLLVLRHGKAVPYDSGGDMARDLTERGRRDSKRMGELIKNKIGRPDLVISSNAVRAHHTAILAAEAVGYQEQIDVRPEIYGASLSGLLGIVQSLSESVITVLVVGHNPGLEELTMELVKGKGPIGGLATAGLVHLQIAGRWDEIEAGNATLLAEYSPREL